LVTVEQRQEPPRNNLFLAQVILTQGPIKQETEIIFDYQDEIEIKIPKTWFRNYFRDFTVYGLELFTEGEKLTWKFFLNSESEHEAKTRGKALLLYLEKLFPGLTGQVIVVPIQTDLFFQDVVLYELKLPKYIKLHRGKVSIIREFIHTFRRNKNKAINLYLYILWQRDDTPVKNEEQKMLKNNRFKTKIYFGVAIKNETLNYDKALIDAQKEFLTMDIHDILFNRAKFEETPPETLLRIIEGKAFYTNESEEMTNFHYQDRKFIIPKDPRFDFLKPHKVDFSFPVNPGLTQPLTWNNTNIIPLMTSKENPNFICIGKVIEQGVEKEQYAYFDRDHFSLSTFIGGTSGSGKTSEICQIQQEFYEKCPDVGILTAYLGNKRNQERFYKSDIVLKYGEFNARYFVKGPDIRQCIIDTAMYLAAVIGIRSAETNLINVMQNYGADNMPIQLGELYGSLLDWFDKHPYHDKYQKDITQLIKDRVRRVLGDPILQKTVQLTPELPDWYNAIRQGKKVFLDMSMCSIDAKRLIMNNIFQMMKALAPRVSDTIRLQYLIIIDEAHQILERAKFSPHYYDLDAIARDQLEKVFKLLLNEFRSRGLAFIIADQEPHKLFDDGATSPALKILFRLDGSGARVFNALTEEEQLKLTHQRLRNALVLNGATGEKYQIRTLDI